MYLHLTQLKKRILPSEQATATRFDDRLSSLAAGVAAAFDGFTARRLLWEVDYAEEFPGGDSVLFLHRYPVASITSLQFRGDEADDFTGLEHTRLSKSVGIVDLISSAGSFDDTIRATYSGGYWADTSVDLSGTIPVGATAIPADLLDAWVLQVDHEARQRKIFGVGKGNDISDAFDGEIEILSRVQKVLNHYSRIV